MFCIIWFGDWWCLTIVLENHCTGMWQQRKQLCLTTWTFTLCRLFLFASNVGHDLYLVLVWKLHVVPLACDWETPIWLSFGVCGDILSSFLYRTERKLQASSLHKQHEKDSFLEEHQIFSYSCVHPFSVLWKFLFINLVSVNFTLIRASSQNCSHLSPHLITNFCYFDVLQASHKCVNVILGRDHCLLWFEVMDIVAHLHFPHSYSHDFWHFFRMWCILLCSYVRWRVIY